MAKGAKLKREISSPATSFYKWFAPTGSLVIFSGYTLSYFTSASAQGLQWAILFCGILALAATWSSLKLRRVWFDGRFLYVASHREEVCIPLSSVTDVEAVGSPYKTIIVTLAAPSRLGRRVMFVPMDRGARDPHTGLHPTVLELKKAIKAIETAK